MKLLAVASKLDWSGWFAGIGGAFVSGGASAIAVIAATSAYDPSHDMMGWVLIKAMAVAFVISGVVSLAKWLQLHPVPTTPPVSPTAPLGK